MIRLQDVAFSYGGAESFSLTVPALAFEADEHTAIIGPSGCGKTTLLSLIAGIHRAQKGRIENQGNDLSQLGEKARRAFRIRQVGLVFQAFELLDYLDVLDNVLLPYRVDPGLKVTEPVRERARQLIGEVGLTGKLGRRTAELSQGERQRVAVARAPVTRPPLVLADEPTGNLDPSNTLLIIDLLRSVAADSGATIITVTHDHSLLDRFDRVVELEAITGAL
ncbi:MAG: ABC transporter ATP-binding protein [Gammaproteobacteria bacterium]|nr:MAG: ABC transporter ATP-binding protein [Gammaproteobacteria bacterium]